MDPFLSPQQQFVYYSLFYYNLEVKQILIEFHHHFNNISVKSTKNAVARLNNAGYQIFNISMNGHELSFIHLDS